MEIEKFKREIGEIITALLSADSPDPSEDIDRIRFMLDEARSLGYKEGWTTVWKAKRWKGKTQA